MARLSVWGFAAVLASILGGLPACSLISLSALDPPASRDAAGDTGAPDATLGAWGEAGTQGDDSDSSTMTSSDSAEPDDSTLPPDGEPEAVPEGGAKDAASEATTMPEGSADVSAPID